MKVALAAAGAEDLDQLVELLRVLFTQEHELAPDAEKQRRGLARILGDSSVGRIYVARDGALLRLILLTDGDNAGAQRLYERAGFARSGMLPMRLRLRQ